MRCAAAIGPPRVPVQLAANHMKLAVSRAFVQSTAPAPPARIILKRVFHIIAGPGSGVALPVR